MFERNMATHYLLDHPDVVPPQIRVCSGNNETSEQHHEINLINLTMNQIHNRRTDEHIKQEILDQVEPRYYSKGSQNDINGLMYINSPINETFRPFQENFKTTRMVIRACLGFLKPLQRTLKLSKEDSIEFKYLKSEITDQHLAYGQLQDRDVARQKHSDRYNNKNYFSGNQNYKIVNALPNNQIPKLSMQELLCLKGTYCGEKLLEKDRNIWTLPYVKDTIEKIKKLYNIIETSDQSQTVNYGKMWELINTLLQQHTYKGNTKTELSEVVLHDISTLLLYLIKKGKLNELEDSFRAIQLPKALDWFTGIDSMYFNPNQELPSRQKISPLQVFGTEYYEISNITTSVFYGIKIASETKEFAKTKELSKIGKYHNHKWVANKRTTNFGGEKNDPDVEKLLQNHGYESYNLIHDAFSPTTWALAIQAHKSTPETDILKRRFLSHIPAHCGRDRMLMRLQQKYSLIQAQRICDVVISMCVKCKLRNQKIEPSPEARIPLFLLNNQPRPYAVTHIDIAGPAKLLINQGSISTRNQQMTTCYFLLGVCSLTKHTSISVLQGTDTFSVSLALSAMMAKTGRPSLIVADNQSSFVKLMKENSSIMKSGEIIEIGKIPIKLVPAGNVGHQAAGSVEKKIDILRRIIGNFDFTKTSLSIVNLQNLLLTAEGCINRTPIGIRKTNKAIKEISSSPLLKFLTPQTLYDPRANPTTESFIKIEKDINNYMATNENMIKFTTELMNAYLLELHNNGTQDTDISTNLQEGDIVAFKTVDYLHHHYHHPFNMGMISKVYPNGIDNLIRTVDITYLARPGEKVVIDGEVQIISKGLQCTTTRPVRTVIKVCGKHELEDSFKRDAERTEKWLNMYYQAENDKDNAEVNMNSVDKEGNIIETINHNILPKTNKPNIDLSPTKNGKTENERNTEQHIEDDQIIEMISVDEPHNPTHTKNQIIKKFKKTLEGKETNNEETIHVTNEITQKSESIKDKNKPKTTIRFSDESDKVVEVIKNIDTNACTTYPNINKEKVRLHIQYDDTDKMMTDLTNKLTKKKKASKNEHRKEIVLITHEQTSETHVTSENHQRNGNHISNIIRHLVSLVIMLIMLETTIPKSMASSTELVPSTKEISQLHQPWYQNKGDKEKTTTMLENIFTMTTIILMNFATLQFKLIGKIKLIKLALTTTLAFHRQINHTSYCTYPMYILCWIIWVICKRRRKNAKEFGIRRLMYHTQQNQQKFDNTIHLPNVIKILDDNTKLKSEINRTKGLLARTVSKNAVLNNQTINLETTVRNMENKIRYLRNISIDLERTLKNQHKMQSGLRNTVRKTKQALTQATIELSLKDKALQRYKITKSRQDEDNYNLQERNHQLVLNYINIEDENHELTEKMREIRNTHKNEVRKYKELQEKEQVDSKRAWDLCIKSHLSYLEALQQKETLRITLEKTMQEHQENLEIKANKTKELQEKIRMLYNKNTNYRLQLEKTSNSLNLLDKTLITTRHMRQQITTPPNLDKSNDCEPTDNILISTLFMRTEKMTANYRENMIEEDKGNNENKTHKEPRTINIIQNSRMSAKTAIFGGLAILLLLTIKPTKATSYPYTEVKPSYRRYMKPSKIAVESMHQIIDQTNRLIKTDNAHQLERMEILTKKLPDITMISNAATNQLKNIDENTTKLPQTILNYVAAISFIIERQREMTRQLKDEIRRHAIEVIMNIKRVFGNKKKNKKYKRSTSDMDNLLDEWSKLDDANNHLEIPETQLRGDLNDQMRDNLAKKWEQKRISNTDIESWIHTAEDMIHKSHPQASNTNQRIINDKSDDKESSTLDAITEIPTIIPSNLSTIKTIGQTISLDNIMKEGTIHLPGGDMLRVIERSTTHAIFKNNIMEAYFVFNTNTILIGKGVNTEATWITQKQGEGEYTWVKYENLTGRMGEKKLQDSEVSGAEDLEVKDNKEDKMTYISNMMYYTKRFSESFNTLEEMYAFFRMIELETNQGFKNSDANITLKIHCIKMIDTREYEKLTAGRALYKFQQDVPENHADTTTLFTEEFDYKLNRRCGVAFVDVVTKCKQAYSVITKACAFRSQGFAHELGHILGVTHDYNKRTASSANGYRMEVSQPNIIRGLKTIMSYPGRGKWMSINYWSNPDITIHYKGEDYRIGVNTSADAVTTLRKNKIHLSQCGDEDKLKCKCVNCGSYTVATCEMCTLGLKGRADLCKGDCTWNGKYCSLTTVKCGEKHISPGCSQCMDSDVIRTDVMETLKCHAVNYIAEDLRKNDRKFEGFACNSKDENKFHGQHILLHVFNITCINTVKDLDCPRSTEKSYIRKVFQFERFRYHEIAYVVNKLMKAFDENSEEPTTITYEDVNENHRHISFAGDQSFFLDQFYLNRHAKRPIYEYEELGKNIQDFLGKFWCKSKDCEFKNNKCIDNGIIHDTNPPPTTTQVSTILDTIYGYPWYKNDLTYTMCYDYGVLIYNINKNLEKLSPIQEDITSKLDEKLFDPDDVNNIEMENLEKISTSINEFLHGPLPAALTKTTASIENTEKTLKHLDEGIDIMGVMTADTTLQIPKLLDKTTKFIQDVIHKDIQMAKRDKRRKRSTDQTSGLKDLSNNIDDEVNPPSNTEIPYEKYLDGMWDDLSEMDTTSELGEGSSTDSEVMEAIRKTFEELNEELENESKQLDTKQEIDGSGYMNTHQEIESEPPTSKTEKTTLQINHNQDTNDTTVRTIKDNTLIEGSAVITEEQTPIQTTKANPRLQLINNPNKHQKGKFQDQGFQRKFVEALNLVENEDIKLASKLDLIGTRIPSSGPEAAVMLLSNALGIPSNEALDAYDTTKNIYNKTRNILFNNNGITEKDLNTFQNSLVEKLSKVSIDSDTRTFTIKEGEDISIKCFTDTEVESSENIVWKRSDNKPLYNLKTTIKGNELLITNSKCSHRGEYQCGYRSTNEQRWTNQDIGTTWHKIILNIICDEKRSIQAMPSTVIAIETQLVDLSCPTSANDAEIFWTKLSGENASPTMTQTRTFRIQEAKLEDAGLYQCSGNETRHEIYLQVNKLPVDGYIKDQDELGYIEAYDCTNNVIQRGSIDLTEVGKCDINDYAAYHESTNKLIEVVHYKSTNEVKLKACKMNIKIYSGYCRPGNYLKIWYGINWLDPSSGKDHGLDNMDLIIEEQYKLDGDACRKGWKTGEVTFNLGTQQVKIPVKKGEPSHSKTNLYLHGSNFNQEHYNCTPAYGWTQKGPIYRGQDNQYTKKNKHEVIKAEIDLKLEEVYGMTNTKDKVLYIPSAGTEIEFGAIQNIHEIFTATKGTITIIKSEVVSTTCEQYAHVSGGIAEMFLPTEQQSGIPTLMKYNITIDTEHRVLGFQLIKENDICGKKCYNTQFSDIKICIRESRKQFMVKKDVEVISHLGSNSLNLLQLKLDHSIQNIMFLLCKLNRKHYKNSLKDIEVYGPSLINPMSDIGRGTKTIQRGEQAIILQCEKVITLPRSEKGTCCENFPVVLLHKNNQNAYVTPIDRVITNICDPTSCTEVMPISIKNTKDKHICQLNNYLSRCDKPTILQPKRDISGQLDLLRQSELKLSTVEGSLPSQLELYAIISSTKIKATNELMGIITQNKLHCARGQCIPINEKYKRALAHTTLPQDVNYFIFNKALKILAIIALITFYVEKICGLTNIIVKLYNLFGEGHGNCTNLTCCGALTSCCCIVSESMNPLHPKSAIDELRVKRIKKKLKTIHTNHEEFITEQTNLLMDMSQNQLIPLESRDRRKLEEIMNIIDKQDERIKILETKTVKKSKKDQPLKRWRSNSLRIKKYPRTFHTPPSKHKRQHSVRFSIVDENLRPSLTTKTSTKQ